MRTWAGIPLGRHLAYLTAAWHVTVKVTRTPVAKAQLTRQVASAWSVSSSAPWRPLRTHSRPRGCARGAWGCPGATDHSTAERHLFPRGLSVFWFAKRKDNAWKWKQRTPTSREQGPPPAAPTARCAGASLGRAPAGPGPGVLCTPGTRCLRGLSGRVCLDAGAPGAGPAGCGLGQLWKDDQETPAA